MIQVLKEKSIDYDFFIEEIMKRVKKNMGESYTVRIYKVMKNNSLELDSLVVLKEGKNFAPNLYLEPYYESYLEGTPLNELAERLCYIYHHCAVPAINKKFTYSFDEMKSYIIFRLVNYEKNQSLLSQIPHIRQLDLAITFHCMVRDDDEGIGTIRITNDHIKLWDVSINDLISLAKNNTKRLFPASIRSMEEVMKGLLKEESKNSDVETLFNMGIDHMFPKDKPECQTQMYILTNQKGINGASCLLYEDILRDFSSLIHSDLYILPSSIHEIILVPNNNEINKNSLMSMVQEVNRTQVASDEVLSDRVYYYSQEKNKILM